MRVLWGAISMFTSSRSHHQAAPIDFSLPILPDILRGFAAPFAYIYVTLCFFATLNNQTSDFPDSFRFYSHAFVMPLVFKGVKEVTSPRISLWFNLIAVYRNHLELKTSFKIQEFDKQISRDNNIAIY